MNIFVNIFIVGLFILVGAVILNLLAGWIGLSTWYSFALSISNLGCSEAFKKEGFRLIWLFAAYPFLLGLIGYYATILLK